MVGLVPVYRDWVKKQEWSVLFFLSQCSVTSLCLSRSRNDQYFSFYLSAASRHFVSADPGMISTFLSISVQHHVTLAQQIHALDTLRMLLEFQGSLQTTDKLYQVLTTPLHAGEVVRRSPEPHVNLDVFRLASEVVSQGSADIQPMLDTTEASQHTTKTCTVDFGFRPRHRTVMLDQPHTRVRQLHICNDYDHIVS